MFKYLVRSWWFLRRYPVIPIFILILLLIAAAIGPYVTPYERDIGNIADRHLEPFSTSENSVSGKGWIENSDGTFRPTQIVNGYHVLGTDHVGRDIFTRLLHGSRISLMVVTISISTGMAFGLAFAMISGYYGGLIDEVLMRIVDIWNALPFLMVALILTLIFGRGLEIMVVVLFLVAWVNFVRIIRAQILVLKEMDYIASARICGASDFRIIVKHLFPGILNSAIVIATLNTSGLILAESTLSFVGAGIQPPTPAWGVMVNEGRDYLSTAWWQSMVPSAAIFLVVISLNFLGDWLRDRLDPRLRQVD
jgi:peptide/nickel transport system permease protein